MSNEFLSQRKGGRVGNEDDRPPPFNEFKNEWNYTSAVLHVFFAWTEKTLPALCFVFGATSPNGLGPPHSRDF